MTAVYIILGVVVFAALITLFLIAPNRGCKEMRQVFLHANIAHRGLHTRDRKRPENSLAAFKAAAEAGYGIELDLQFSKDEQIVVFHDDTLKRVCGTEGRVDAYTYDELCRMSLCNTEERIPLFSEVLEVVDGRVPLVVEFKNGPKNALLCSKTLPMLRAYKGQYCIESFSPIIVQWFKKNAPDIMRGQLACPYKDYRKDKFSVILAFALSHNLLNVLGRPHFTAYNKTGKPLSVKLCDKMGAMSFAWTVRPEDDLNKLQKEFDSLIFELYTPPVKYDK